MHTAFQDTYADKYSHCYGCGKLNPHGHQLKSHWDGDGTVARYTPRPEHSGGVPGHVYGGLIASLLDCHGTASAAAFAHRAEARSPGGGESPVRYVTASLRVDFRRPTPMAPNCSSPGDCVTWRAARCGSIWRSAHRAKSAPRVRCWRCACRVERPRAFRPSAMDITGGQAPVRG